jgi:hypothetical protein
VAFMKADKAKEFLSNLSVEERIAAVAQDVTSGKKCFASIEAHDLAELLGVPQPDQPDDSWSRTIYAERQTLEEYIDLNDGIIDEIPDILDGCASEKRIAAVAAKCQAYADGSIDSFDFLKPKERALILKELEERELESLRDNGIGCVATYSVEHGDHELWFEGDIEDDGSCIDLKGPYDGVDGSGRDPDEWISSDL